jgi:hypothetical protein
MRTVSKARIRSTYRFFALGTFEALSTLGTSAKVGTELGEINVSKTALVKSLESTKVVCVVIVAGLVLLILVNPLAIVSRCPRPPIFRVVNVIPCRNPSSRSGASVCPSPDEASTPP